MARFVHEVHMRWSDMDAYRHINNSAYLAYLEQARVAMFFFRHQSFSDGTVISRHEIDYLRPVDYGEAVRIESWISELRAASFAVSYELFDGDVLASRAKTVCVPYNLTEQFPRRLTGAERDFLAPYLEA